MSQLLTSNITAEDHVMELYQPNKYLKSIENSVIRNHFNK